MAEQTHRGGDTYVRGCLEEGLRAVRDGRITFDQFFVQTRPRWRQIAEAMYRRWDLPSWLSIEDMEQEMLLAAFRACWRFDEDPNRIAKTKRRSRHWKRGSVELFAVWNALHAAAKVATIARIGRRPHRGEGRGVPSNYEIPTSAVSRERDDGHVLVPVVVVPATHEEDLIRADFFEKLFAHKAAQPRRLECFRVAYRALSKAAGDVDAAVSAIYADPDLRERLTLASEGDAKKLVRRAILDIAPAS